jgi:hypothetical protein
MNSSNPGAIPKKLVSLAPSAGTATAYLQVAQAFAEVIAKIEERLDELSGAMNVVATYLERKGTEEGIFSPEDIKSMRGEEDEGEDEPQ